MVAGGGGLDSARKWLSLRGGVGAGQGEGGRGAKTRAGAAGFGQSNAGGGLCSALLARARGRRRRGGENEVGHREGIRATRRPRITGARDVWNRWRPVAVWAPGTVENKEAQ